MKRRLAAILIADVVGFSRLMEADEAGALAALQRRWKAHLEPIVAAKDGRIVKYLGDGALIEFASVVSALEAALAVQNAFEGADPEGPEDRRIRLRIGLNFGDVIGEGEDIYGDGVNIASRLEPLAPPGGVCVSGKVRDEVREAVDCAFEDFGERKLKNISRPVRVYRVLPPGAKTETAAPLPLPDRPSIAVVPFQNMSADPDQDYFADGMVEDIITELARVKWLFVISRNSSFAYRGDVIDIRKVGRELGVRYVLEGSVRRSGQRLRITGQLIDATTGAHLWADRYDGTLEDIFDFQDNVTEHVVSAIAPRVEQAEIERARSKPPSSLDAYDHYLRGLAGFNRFEKDGNKDAMAEFAAARAIDPTFAPALGMAARAYGQRLGFAWIDDYPSESAEALRLAREAVKHGFDDNTALAGAGFACILFGALEEGDSYLDKALDISPNQSGAWHVSALAKILMGDPEEAERRSLKSLRLSPQDPQMFGMQGTLAFSRLMLGRGEEAVQAGIAAHSARPGALFPAMVLAGCYVLTERMEDARATIEVVAQIDPKMRIAEIRRLFRFRREADQEKFAQYMRAAGLPE